MSCILDLSAIIQSRFPTRYYPAYAQNVAFEEDENQGKYTRLKVHSMDFASDIYAAGNC